MVRGKTGEDDGIEIPVLTLGNADAQRIREAFLGGRFVEADLYHDMLEDGDGNGDGTGDGDGDGDGVLPPAIQRSRSLSLKISKKVRAATRGTSTPDPDANLEDTMHMHMPSAGGAAATISLGDWKDLGPDEQPALYFPVKDLDIMQQLFPGGMPAGLEAGGSASPAPTTATSTLCTEAVATATRTEPSAVRETSRPARAKTPEPEPEPKPEPEPVRAAAAAAPQEGTTVHTDSGQAYIKAPVGVHPVPGWLHGAIERGVVEALLKSGGDAAATHGRFLIREIEPAAPFLAAYCLSVMYKGKPTHHPIGMSEKVPGALAVGRYLSVYPDPTGSENLVELVHTLSHPMVGTKEGAAFYPHWPVRLADGVRSDGTLVVTVAGGGAGESADAGAGAGESERRDADAGCGVLLLPPPGGTAGGLMALTHDWTHRTEAMANKEDVKAWATDKLGLGGGMTKADNGKFVVLTFEGKHVLALIHKVRQIRHH